MRLYHADRRSRLHAGSRLALQRVDDEALGPLLHHLHALYPDGISGWGFYLVEPVDSVDERDEAELYASLLVEQVFESVRRSRFPERPCRFQSIYAFDDVERAQEFRTFGDDNEAPIWVIETDDEPFRGDMSWVQMGGSLLETSYFAHQYWSGERSPEPAWEWVCPLPVDVVERAT